ncbi:unnamed protein product [Cuscuta epithymum]|nr:unnamed protein product [Cuscuta epithymum]CAH9128771.1 unnamed protein product [Cuscuta epithymum]
MCFLSRRGRHAELVRKVHTAMNSDDQYKMLDLFGKYPTTLPGGKVLFVSIPLTDDQSLGWFLDVASLSQPVHVYAVAAPKRNDEPEDNPRSTTGAITEIYVKTMTGKTIVLEVESSDIIRDLKEQIEDLEGMPVEKQNLLFNGRSLANHLTIGDYNIPNKSEVDLLPFLCGC